MDNNGNTFVFDEMEIERLPMFDADTLRLLSAIQRQNEMMLELLIEVHRAPPPYWGMRDDPPTESEV